MFAIKTQSNTSLYGSVVIRKLPNESRNQRRALDRYDILYTRDFNPNSKEFILFRKEVPKEFLDTYLVSLCKYFYEQQNEGETVLHHIYRDEETKTKEASDKTTIVHQCKYCFTVYDEEYGDEANQISPKTPFSALDASYECPVCSAPKEDFTPIEKGSTLYAQM